MGGNQTLRFYAGGQQLAERTNGTVTYLHQDHLGSTRLKTNSSGARVFASNYVPFGVTSGGFGSEGYKFAGKWEDPETTLYYFGARYYMPGIGRFITEDPAAPTFSDPQTLNRYVYCRNNPHKYTDPDGKLPQIVIAMAAGAFMGAIFNSLNLVNTCSQEGRIPTENEWKKAIVTGAIGGAITGISVTTPLGFVGSTTLSSISNVVQDAASAYIDNKEYTVGDTFSSAIVGAANGAVSCSVSKYVAPEFMVMKKEAMGPLDKFLWAQIYTWTFMKSAVNYIDETLWNAYTTSSSTSSDTEEPKI